MNRRPITTTGRRAFTLVEVLVVVVIIAAVSTVAVGTLGLNSDAARTRSTESALRDADRSARRWAYLRGRAVVLRFEASEVVLAFAEAAADNPTIREWPVAGGIAVFASDRADTLLADAGIPIKQIVIGADARSVDYHVLVGPSGRTPPRRRLAFAGLTGWVESTPLGAEGDAR